MEEYNLVEMTEEDIYAAIVEGGDLLPPIRLVAFSLHHFAGTLEKTSKRVYDTDDKEEFIEELRSMGLALSGMDLMMSTAKKTLAAANRAASTLSDARDIFD